MEIVMVVAENASNKYSYVLADGSNPLIDMALDCGRVVENYNKKSFPVRISMFQAYAFRLKFYSPHLTHHLQLN